VDFALLSTINETINRSVIFDSNPAFCPLPLNEDFNIKKQNKRQAEKTISKINSIS